MDRLVLAQLTQLYMTVKLECPFYGVNIRRLFYVVVLVFKAALFYNPDVLLIYHTSR